MYYERWGPTLPPNNLAVMQDLYIASPLLRGNLVRRVFVTSQKISIYFCFCLCFFTVSFIGSGQDSVALILPCTNKTFWIWGHCQSFYQTPPPQSWWSWLAEILNTLSIISMDVFLWLSVIIHEYLMLLRKTYTMMYVGLTQKVPMFIVMN